VHRFCFSSMFFRQRLNTLGFGFLLTVGAFCFFPGVFLYPLAISAALSLLVFALFPVGAERKRIALFFALGISLALILWSVNGIDQKNLQKEEGKTASLEGVVTFAGEDYYDLSCMSRDGEFFFRKVRVLFPDSMPEPGEVCSVKGLLSASLTKAQLQDRVSLVLREAGDAEILGSQFLLRWISQIRSLWGERLGSDRIGGFFQAILLGERFALTEEDQSAFQIAASSHLLAISGLHVSQILGFFICLFRLFPLPYRVRRLLFFPVIFFFILLTGASVSVFRAGFMTAMAFSASLLRRRGDSLTALTFSAFLLVLIEPFAITDFSFLFSFLSTFAIVVAAAPLCEHLQWLLDRGKNEKTSVLSRLLSPILSSFAVAVCVFTFTFPMQVVLLDSVQLLTPIASLILIPLFSPVLFFALLLALFGSVPFLGTGVELLAKKLAELFLDLVSLLGDGFIPAVSYGKAGYFPAILVTLILCYFVAGKKKVYWVLFLYPIIFSVSLFFLI